MPLRSPVITLLDISFRGFFKDKVHSSKPQTIEDLNTLFTKLFKKQIQITHNVNMYISAPDRKTKYINVNKKQFGKNVQKMPVV